MSIYNEIFKRECETKFGTFVKYFIFFKKDDGGIESYQVYLTKEDYLKVKGGKKPEELQIPIETINFILHSKIPRDENGNIINTGYVTNATANSVVYFALSFLNSNFFSVEQIKRLRLKYSIGNFIDGRFNKDEILNSFLVQSAFYLNLHTYMTENDRFENFLNELDKQKLFHQYYRHYDSPSHLMKNYERKIFHTQLDCDSMTSDYSKNDVFHQNTGVFSNKVITKNVGFYALNSAYLLNLGMKCCEKCNYG